MASGRHAGHTSEANAMLAYRKANTGRNKVMPLFLLKMAAHAAARQSPCRARPTMPATAEMIVADTDVAHFEAEGYRYAHLSQYWRKLHAARPTRCAARKITMRKH